LKYNIIHNIVIYIKYYYLSYHLDKDNNNIDKQKTYYIIPTIKYLSHYIFEIFIKKCDR